MISPSEQGRTFNVENEREKLSKEEVANLLAAIGNHEAKALTLVAMQERVVYTRTSLLARIKNIQGVIPSWIMASGVLFNYGVKSFAPIGLVAKELLDPELNTIGLTRTEYGANIGVPLAGHLLEFSERQTFSLNQLFGSTHSAAPENDIRVGDETQQYKKRSPEIRIKIIKSLVKSSGAIRVVDISKEIEEDNRTVGRHLSELARFGIIEYESADVDIRVTYYKLADNSPQSPPPAHATSTGVPTRIIDFLKKNAGESFSIDELINRMTLEGFKKRRAAHAKSAQGSYLSTLGMLVKLGYVSREKFEQSLKSIAKISDGQRAVLEEVLAIIDGITSRNIEFLKQGKIKAENIISDPSRAAALFKKAKESSVLAARNTTQDNLGDILSIISQNPNISSLEIREHLEKVYGKRLSKTRIFGLLKILTSNSLILESERKNASYWTAVV